MGCGSGPGPRVEIAVRLKLWLGGAVALVVAGLLCLVSPRLGGFALIVLALGAVVAFAFRFL
jgi:hypothetical protein